MLLPSRHFHPSRGIIVVGGGLAGQRCAETLRRLGYDGRLRMVCAESHPPYDRPPLSKDVLAGAREASSLGYRPAGWYEEHAVELLLGVSATKLRPGEHRLLIAGDSSLRYDRLLIACGSRPRMLPMLAGFDNVSVLRSAEDSLRLRDVLSARMRLAIVGAGFIGQEVAATARGRGAAVTMIEGASCPLERVLGPELGGWFTWLHRAEGVEVECGCTLTRVEGNHGVRRLSLSNGRVVEADHVLVGIGVDPETGWLAGSGLEGTGGVPVDEHGRSAAGDVMAAGDAAATYDPLLGAHAPGSHWEAAGRQGARAARMMLGLEPGAASRTSFWTDQYGIRIQYLGHAPLADRVEVTGDPAARSFSATFSRAGRPVAALLVNRPRELATARHAIEKGA